ncbi:MAG: pyridoxal-phosphate dependent enzyme, partial [Pseudomonadota bacterium]
RNARLSGSLCDAIITPQPGEITFPIMQAHCGPGIIVTEDECLRAMAHAFERLKIVIEPGGAAALAAALFHPDAFESDAVIAVATGGNVDAAIFTQALETLS